MFNNEVSRGDFKYAILLNVNDQIVSAKLAEIDISPSKLL